jgi:hypothetical protein
VSSVERAGASAPVKRRRKVGPVPEGRDEIPGELFGNNVSRFTATLRDAVAILYALPALKRRRSTELTPKSYSQFVPPGLIV